MIKPNTSAASFCFSAALLWPALAGAVINATLSPIDRIARDAWCDNANFGAVLLGHCAPCWAGSATLALAGVLCLVTQPFKQRRRA